MIAFTNQAEIPALPGSYGLLLALKTPAILRIGRLGERHFAAGWYLYLGSARGLGGLRARLGRHLHGGGRRHWHIDHLRAVTRVAAIFFSLAPDSLECSWSQALAHLPQAAIPVAAFGASDCPAGCQAHLLHFPYQPLPVLVSQITSCLASHDPYQASQIVCFLANQPASLADLR